MVRAVPVTRSTKRAVWAIRARFRQFPDNRCASAFVAARAGCETQRRSCAPAAEGNVPPSRSGSPFALFGRKTRGLRLQTSGYSLSDESRSSQIEGLLDGGRARSRGLREGYWLQTSGCSRRPKHRFLPGPSARVAFLKPGARSLSPALVVALGSASEARYLFGLALRLEVGHPPTTKPSSRPTTRSCALCRDWCDHARHAPEAWSLAPGASKCFAGTAKHESGVGC